MKDSHKIMTMVCIRLDGSLSILENDTDDTILKLCDIENPDQIDPEEIGALYLRGQINVPENCSRLIVSKSSDGIAVNPPADVIQMMERMERAND